MTLQERFYVAAEGKLMYRGNVFVDLHTHRKEALRRDLCTCRRHMQAVHAHACTLKIMSSQQLPGNRRRDGVLKACCALGTASKGSLYLDLLLHQRGGLCHLWDSNARH